MIYLLDVAYGIDLYPPENVPRSTYRICTSCLKAKLQRWVMDIKPNNLSLTIKEIGTKLCGWCDKKEEG